MKKHYLIIILTAIFLLQVAYAQPITIISIGDDITIPYETIDNSPEVIISTIESSLCKYSDINKTFLEMENTFTQDEENVTHNHIISQKAIGEYEIYIKCQNNDYINSSLNSSFTINEIPDITPPVITISNINSDSEDPYQVNIENVTIIILTDENSICKYDDTNSDYDLMSLNFVGENLEHTLLLENLPSGNYSSYIGCSDIDDNPDSKIIEFEVIINEDEIIPPTEEDTVPPTITINNPKNGEIFTNGFNFIINVTINETANSCIYTINNSNSVSFDETNSIDFITTETKLFNGEYDLKIACSDLFNNTGESQITFSINDNIDPSITIQSIGSDSNSPYETTDTTPLIVIETNEPSFCKFSYVNLNYTNMTTMSSTLPYNTSHSITSQAQSIGSKTNYVTCLDSNNNIKNISFSYNIIAKPPKEDNDDDDDDSSSSNRNSGSSQGVSIPSKLLSNEYSTLWLDLEQGEHSMIIAKESFPVTEIIFDVKNNIKNTVKITITKLDKPNMFLNNETYNYFKITKEGILDDNIENINIIFKVDKSWIKNNEIENILLHKYKGKWKELITIFLKKDNNYEYFKTTLSEFGEFAISGEKIEPIIILTEESIEEPQFTGNLNFENSLSRNTEETMPLDLAPDTNKTQALNLVFPLMGLISFSFLSLYFVFHFKYPVANELQIAQIKSYIDQSFDNGTHQETIKKRLVNVGWNPHLIDMMILNVHTPSGNKKNLERYIRSSKKNGLSSIIVKENLLKRGWSKNILQKFLIEHYVEDY
ncbi:PGF-pre-PGF domain-containing protein [archaeon]|nr:PGF-pre-PGF domain-containing protein [archaeon]